MATENDKFTEIIKLSSSYILDSIGAHGDCYLSGDNTKEKEGVEVDYVVDIIEDTVGPNNRPNQDTETKRNYEHRDGLEVPSSKELIIVC